MRVSVLAGLGLLIAMLVPRHALAQAKPEPTLACLQKTIQGDYWRCSGQVEFVDGDTKLYADELEWFRDQDRVVASGNVVFSQGANQIAANRAEFNTKTHLGTFYSAMGMAPLQAGLVRNAPGAGFAPPARRGAQADIVIFFGEIVEKVGPKKFRITRGGFSTCLQPIPRWDITASRITLKVDDYALLRNSVLNVKGVPILYLPIMYYPTDEDGRSTGILLPTYSQSDLRGPGVSNAFFWAINRSHDATIKHDWYSRTGQGFGAEYRYALTTGDAVAETYLLRDHETVYGNGGGVLPASTSYFIRGRGNQQLPYRMHARFNVDYASSFQAAQTVTTDINDLSRHRRTYGGNVVGSWGNYSLNGTFERTEYFTGAESSSLTGGSPRVSFLGSDRQIFGSSGLYASFTSDFAHIDSETRNAGDAISRSLSRFEVAPTLRYPFKKWQWLTVNSRLTWRETAYSRTQDPTTGIVVDEGLNRQVVTFQADAVGPVFNRVWDTPGLGYAEKFKHAIEPFVTVMKTTAVDDFDRIVKLDSSDNVVGSTTYTYGVNNRFYAKRRRGAVSQAQEIVNVEIRQSYYTDERAAERDAQYTTALVGSPPSKFSPIRLNVRATPTVGATGTLSAEFDSKSKELRTLSATSSYNWAGGSVLGGWSQTFFVKGLPGFDNPDALSRYLTLSSNLHTPDNRFGGSYAFNYNAVKGSFERQTFGGFYNAQCCGIAIQYQRFSYATGAAPIPVDRRFFISFSLAGLGNFSPFNGALGGFPR